MLKPVFAHVHVPAHPRLHTHKLTLPHKLQLSSLGIKVSKHSPSKKSFPLIKEPI